MRLSAGWLINRSGFVIDERSLASRAIGYFSFSFSFSSSLFRFFRFFFCANNSRKNVEQVELQIKSMINKKINDRGDINELSKVEEIMLYWH